ncbi:MAG: imidazole glycerol phosphate synthase subunit HisH [Alphaproteobacteria bacterium]
MKLVIVDYDSGNLHSAAKAFERAAFESDAKARIAVSGDAAALAQADRVVLPGVGAFGDCMAALAARPGLVETLEKTVIAGGRPFLGICVGMQLMATRGLEHGEHAGLDWIAGEVVRLAPADATLKVPHMGWNELDIRAPDHLLLAGIAPATHMYFVHGYHFVCARADSMLASVDYGGPVSAMIAEDNLAGVQFHPEKSQAAGLRLIANFLGWRP